MSDIQELMFKMSSKLAKATDRHIYLSMVDEEERARALEQFKREDILEVLEDDK